MAITISPRVTAATVLSTGTLEVTGTSQLHLDPSSSGQDAKTTFSLQGSDKFVMGIDESTSNDDFVLSRGATLGTNNVISVDGSNGTITANITGTSTTSTNITAAANATNADQYVAFLDNANTSAQQVLYDAGLVYNPSSNQLTTTTFVGALTGNVTGNVSGSAATVTGAAQSAITSVGTLTSLTMGGNINLAGAGTVYGILEVSGNDANSARLIGNEAASATNPTLVPDRSEEATGIGGTSTYVSTIVGGAEQIRTTASDVDLINNSLSHIGNANSYWTDGTLTIENDGFSGAIIRGYSTTATTTGYLSIGKSDHGTLGTHGAVDADDVLGNINFTGSDGSSFVNAARISALATETFSGSARGSKLVFSTVDNTTTTLDSKMTIDHDGRVSVLTGSGTATPHSGYDDLTIYGGSSAGITIGTNSTSGWTSIQFGDSGGSVQGTVGYGHPADYLYFRAGNADVARMYSSGIYLLNNMGIFDVGHADSAWNTSGLIVGGTNGWAIGNQTSVQRISNNSGTFSMLNSSNAWADVQMAALQVNGAISMYNSGTLGLVGDIQVTGGSGTTVRTDGTYIRRDNSAGDLFFDSQGSVRVNIDSNANNTDKKFSVGGDASASDLFSVAEDGNVTITDGTLYVDSGTTNTVAKFESSDGDAIINILDSATDTSYPTRILVQGNDMYLMAGETANHSKGIMLDNDGFTRMRGHVAFGNNYLYDVGHADSYWTNDGAMFASANVGAKVYIKSTATNGYPSLRMVNDVQEWRIYAPDGSIGGTASGGNDGFHIYDGTNSAYRLSLTTNGLVGFGVQTFDNWITGASGYTVLTIGNKQSSILGTTFDTTGSWTGWQNNAYLDATDSRWEYVTSSTGASNIYQYNGSIYFRVAASGTADNAITWSSVQTWNTTGTSFNNYGIYDAGNANSHWDSNGLQIGIGDLTLYSGHMITISNSHSGSAQKIHLNNQATAASSASTIEVYVNGQNDSDAGILFATTYSTNVYWKAGIDQSNSKSFAISNNAEFGTNDALRITAATPPVTTYNTTHPTGTFDYVCESCGRHEAEQFECCGKVEWHDDVIDYRGMALRNPDAINYMEKIGVIERTIDDNGKPEVFTVLGRDFEFAMSAAFQNRERMDYQYDEMMRKINRLEKELQEVRNGI